MKKVLWMSRHPMTDDQMASLKDRYGEIRVTAENHTWAASLDGMEDRVANMMKWCRMMESFDVIAGVFPPVALEGLFSAVSQLKWDADDVVGFDAARFTADVIAPVSAQTREQRADGTAQTAFRHVRWVILFRSPRPIDSE